jgi:hypothetical protein
LRFCAFAPLRELFAALTLLALAPATLVAQQPEATIAAKVAAMRKIDGFVPLYWSEADGRIYLEVSRFDTEMLYQLSLATGLGSNPVGLDRGQLGATYVVVFHRVGPRVLLVARNYDYRARSENPAERRAVRDSFAESVLWGFTAVASEGGRVLVDATDFFVRDAHGVAARLRDTQQGTYRLDASRSAPHVESTKGFPKNTEVGATLTFVTEGQTGPLVRQVAPTAEAVTVQLHHSLVELPGPGFVPRGFDPRVASLFVGFNDYATPIDAPLEQRYVVRHRLVKRDPSAAVSEPVEPIVYYVDNGAPEPIRSALVEGASWWNQAFEAAGFRNAFQVRVLPEDADPMDVRYNVVRWVHRSTRGWSYGGSVVDPRTGEILKGNVLLGSLRVRQDYMLGSGLVPPRGASCGAGDAPGAAYLAAAGEPEAVAMSLARIRQLSAHEVGHAIGFDHNFAASTYNRGSVMDYPAPLVEIRDGRLDLSNAYARGIGEYDKFAVTYQYSHFAPGVDERAALASIVRDGVRRGLLFISDDHARPPSAADPRGSLWDNGPDAVAMLRHEMEVRRIGLAGFDLRQLAEGEPLSLLESRLVPLFLHHRFQLQAAVKNVGGAHFAYAVKEGAGAAPAEAFEVVAPARQRDALKAVLETLDPRALALPRRILDRIPPTAHGYGNVRLENFARRTDPTFDALAPASMAADLAVSALVDARRAARLEDFHSRDTANPGFVEVTAALVDATFATPPSLTPHERAVARAVQWVVVTRLTDLAASADAAPTVRAIASDALRRLALRLKTAAGTGDDAVHRRGMRAEIERFLSRPDEPRRQTPPLPIPQGEPIGGS